MDVTICMLMHLEEWVPWSMYQIEKQHNYLKKMNISHQFLIGYTKFEFNRMDIPYDLQLFIRSFKLDDNHNLGELRTDLCEKVPEISKYIAFMDSDDWYPDYRIYKQWVTLDVTHAKYKIDVASVNEFLCLDIFENKSFWCQMASESCLFFTNKYYQNSDGFSGNSSEAMDFVKNSDVLMEDRVELIVALSHSKNTVKRGNINPCKENGLPEEVETNFTNFEKEFIDKIRLSGSLANISDHI